MYVCFFMRRGEITDYNLHQTVQNTFHVRSKHSFTLGSYIVLKNPFALLLDQAQQVEF